MGVLFERANGEENGAHERAWDPERKRTYPTNKWIGHPRPLGEAEGKGGREDAKRRSDRPGGGERPGENR